MDEFDGHWIKQATERQLFEALYTVVEKEHQLSDLKQHLIYELIWRKEHLENGTQFNNSHESVPNDNQ